MNSIISYEYIIPLIYNIGINTTNNNLKICNCLFIYIIKNILHEVVDYLLKKKN